MGDSLSHPQETGSQRLFFRLCDPEEVREYFESVEFEISDEEWWELAACRTEVRENGCGRIAMWRGHGIERLS